jgi:hypothetical protein
MRVDVQGLAPLCAVTCGHDEWRQARRAAGAKDEIAAYIDGRAKGAEMRVRATVPP